MCNPSRADIAVFSQMAAAADEICKLKKEVEHYKNREVPHIVHGIANQAIKNTPFYACRDDASFAV